MAASTAEERWRIVSRTERVRAGALVRLGLAAPRAAAQASACEQQQQQQQRQQQQKRKVDQDKREQQQKHCDEQEREALGGRLPKQAKQQQELEAQ